MKEISSSILCNYHKYLFLPQRSLNLTHTALTVEWSRKSRAVEEQPQKTHKPNTTERAANCSKAPNEGRREKWEGAEEII